MICPLCSSIDIQDFFKDKRREYFKCSSCSLIFVDRDCLLSKEEEKERYDLHDNTINNSGYVRYLSDIPNIISNLNIKNPKVLDFGSGKNTVLEILLKREGFSCFSYDPLYNIGLDFLSQKFDIVVLFEVIEHAYNIENELDLISRLLKKGSVLILRTELLDDSVIFKNWWYKEDPTHVNFFNFQSIENVVEKVHGEIISRMNNICIIKKN